MSASRCQSLLWAECYQRAGAGRWGLPADAFGAALDRSAAKAGLATADADTLAAYLNRLHLDDLALACACEQGLDAAWEHFVGEYGPVLRRAATAIAGAAGPDLADALVADLFGLTTRAGERQSLFRYFHGRSSLATWLRAVLSQRHVDSIRAARRAASLPEDDAPDAPVAPAPPPPEEAALAARVASAMAAAMARLPPRDRLRLAWYYAHDMTMAQIGRALEEHEATVSRHLSRTRQMIREDVQRTLAEAGWSEATIAEAVTAAVADTGDASLHRWLGPEASRKPAGPDRSTDEGRP